jgi:hypothetical protein
VADFLARRFSYRCRQIELQTKGYLPWSCKAFLAAFQLQDANRHVHNLKPKAMEDLTQSYMFKFA